eukprot:5403425-Pyramimonas_sp.AAC.1
MCVVDAERRIGRAAGDVRPSGLQGRGARVPVREHLARAASRGARRIRVLHLCNAPPRPRSFAATL